MAAKMPMIAITMSSSMSVKPAALLLRRLKFILPPYEATFPLASSGPSHRHITSVLSMICSEVGAFADVFCQFACREFRFSVNLPDCLEQNFTGHRDAPG